MPPDAVPGRCATSWDFVDNPAHGIQLKGRMLTSKQPGCKHRMFASRGRPVYMARMASIAVEVFRIRTEGACRLSGMISAVHGPSYSTAFSAFMT